MKATMRYLLEIQNMSSKGEVLTSGGRVLGVTATGENIATAISRAYEAVEKIQWDSIHYRKDIGHRVRI